ncbi:hypothetical protein B0H14DRAFT_3026889 [Mycena olivaceomarginata]|nr:hypothetical protein B0H14DRAFT_3026889 [Mycena olivaceomarginata]
MTLTEAAAQPLVPTHILAAKMHKGKARRSWPQLPPRTVRVLATFHLRTEFDATPLPSVWEDQRHSLVYGAIRCTRRMEDLMNVCVSWGQALETHNFWNDAISLFDPYRHYQLLVDLNTPLVFHSRPPTASPYSQFSILLSSSCVPCCIKAPQPGLATGTTYTVRFGPISLCAAHYDQKWCGMCLKDNTVAKNDDQAVFPGAHATCRACRAEWLWRSALLLGSAATDPLGLGLPVPHGMIGCTAPASFSPTDPVVRGALAAFVDFGDGTTHQVLAVAGECGWLHARTRWTEFMKQALAAERFSCGSDVDEDCGEPGTEDDDDAALALEPHVKKLALDDWARARVLDGLWLAPLDACYFSGEVNLINAGPHPPTPSLSTAVQNAHIRQMRDILLPPLRNVVRRVVVESALEVNKAAAAGVDRTLDPAVCAARMSLADVLYNLHEEHVWFDGTDWNKSREALPFANRLLSLLPTPRQLGQIPYVPKTITHLPPSSMDVLAALWREACAPLYHCLCTICKRAVANAWPAKQPAPVFPSFFETAAFATEETGAPSVGILPGEDDLDDCGPDSVVSLVDDGKEDINSHSVKRRAEGNFQNSSSKRLRQEYLKINQKG